MRAVRYGVTRHHVLGPRGRAGRRHGAADRREVRQVLDGLRPDPAAHRLRGHAGRHDRGDGQGPAPVHRRRPPSWPRSPPWPRWPRRAAHRAAAGINPSILEYVDVLVMGGITQAAGLDLGMPEDGQGAAPWPISWSCSRAWTSEPGSTRTSSGWARCSSELGALDVYVLPAARRERSSSPPGSGLFFVSKAAGCDDIIDAVIPRAAIPDYLARVAELAQRARRLRHGLRPRRRRQRPPRRLPARRREAARPHAREIFRTGARRRGRHLGRARHRDGEAAVLPRDARIRCRSSSCAPSSGPSTPRASSARTGCSA